MEATSAYNLTIGSYILNVFGDTMSTPRFVLKLCQEIGNVATIHADQQVARQCYVNSLKKQHKNTLNSGEPRFGFHIKGKWCTNQILTLNIVYDSIK